VTSSTALLPKRSTTTNLLQCEFIVAQHLNSDNACDIILLDFAKAFDKVNHGVLLSKLSRFGIGGRLYGWLADFLRDRTQFVTYSDVTSSCMPVTSGVVQGSVVGPLLFTLMIDDLPQHVNWSDILLFADDVKLIAKAATPADGQRTQGDVASVEQWSVDNKLPISQPKNQCLHVGSRNAGHVYSLGGTPIPVVERCTDLGLLRTADFKYNAHITAMVSKASRATGMLLRAFSSRKPSLVTKLFTTYVRPMLEYVAPVWNTASATLERDIERVQRRLTKRMHGLQLMSYTDRLNFLHLDSLAARRQRIDLMTIRKALSGDNNHSQRCNFYSFYCLVFEILS
jgi:ribonuclease P/MRP protein subunit RPP40